MAGARAHVGVWLIDFDYHAQRTSVRVQGVTDLRHSFPYPDRPHPTLTENTGNHRNQWRLNVAYHPGGCADVKLLRRGILAG